MKTQDLRLQRVPAAPTSAAGPALPAVFVAEVDPWQWHCVSCLVVVEYAVEISREGSAPSSGGGPPGESSGSQPAGKKGKDITAEFVRKGSPKDTVWAGVGGQINGDNSRTAYLLSQGLRRRGLRRRCEQLR